MIRKTTLNLNNANIGKQQTLLDISTEYNRVVNLCIDDLWEQEQFSGSFVKDTAWIDTYLSARMKQCAAKQALAIVKSQRKKEQKTKPVFNKRVMELDSRFVELEQDVNSFDCWITLSSIGKKLKLQIPTQKHAHFNRFLEQGWTLKKSLRIRVNAKGFWADVYFQKQAPAPKKTGTVKGFDIGYKKLLVNSDGQQFGKDFEQYAEKIARKQQGSKGFLRALTERNQFVNQTVNALPLENVKTVVVENLKSVKHKSKGKIRKSFNNKLQRWTYPLVLERLTNRCECEGISMTFIDPAYTSQTCSDCGIRDKLSRKGERFQCRTCGVELDADWNGAKNILQKGVRQPIVAA
jgi:putative transposase